MRGKSMVLVWLWVLLAFRMSTKGTGFGNGLVLAVDNPY